MTPLAAVDPFVECFSAHRELITAARTLSVHLQHSSPTEAAELKAGADALRHGAQVVLSARDERTMVRAWLDCEDADRRIRSATYRALARGRIANADYDRLFAAAIWAGGVRSEQLQRLRLRLRLLAVI